MNYWKLFRLIFVIFSLYLMGDAFSRWDGFSYYASFSEFLPSVALASILWSIVAGFTTIIVWLLLRILEWFWRLKGLKIKIEHVLFFFGAMVLTGSLVWKGKRVIWPDVQTTVQVKTAVLIGAAFLSLSVTWLLHRRAEKWLKAIHDRIIPLVWFFGLFVVLSIPVVSYHAWLKTSERVSSGIAFKSSVSETNRPNIILVTFDALAARNMSAYGYHKETTPFISEWAKNASVFNMAEAGSNFTTPAVASLMTGKRVWTHQTYHIAGTRPVRSRVESLPATLKESDYFNIALVVNPFASIHALGMSESFDISPPATEFGTAASLFGWKFGIIDKVLYRAFGEKIRLHNWVLKNDFILSRFLNLISRNIYETTVPPERVFDRFINIIDDSPEKPFFAWIHVFPPHDPYLPPEPYEGTLNPSVENRSYKEQERLIEESYTYLFQISSFPETMNTSVEVMRDYYDEFIMYIDKEFENFIGELNKRHINNTVIILTSDHGESFEHGYFTHGGPFLYEQVTHIPLVIKETGQGRGQVIRERVEQIDIPATILDLVNIPVPSWMEGRSLVPLLRGGNLPLRPTFSMNFEGNRSRGHQITNGSIAVWEGDYKLIHYLEKGESVLFNIRHDPGELYNVINTEYDIGRRLLGLIQHNLKKANERIFEER